MKSLILAALLALTLASVCSADLADNQIDDGGEQPQEEAGRFVRPRSGYAVKSCKPCGGQNQCQVMGMQRFAEPRCEALGGLGAPCRPFQEAENKTLSFPNSILYCNDVYMQFCPCARGLVCDLEEAECRLPARQRPTTSTRRPQLAGRNFYQFDYAKPERYETAAAPSYHVDEGFGELESEGAELRPLVPMEQQQRDSWSATARRAPQWPWAVAAAAAGRFH